MIQQDVVSVHSRGFSGNSVDLTVHVKGNAIDFCDQLDGQKISGFRVSVMECRGDKVTAELQTAD